MYESKGNLKAISSILPAVKVLLGTEWLQPSLVNVRVRVRVRVRLTPPHTPQHPFYFPPLLYSLFMLSEQVWAIRCPGKSDGCFCCCYSGQAVELYGGWTSNALFFPQFSTCPFASIAHESTRFSLPQPISCPGPCHPLLPFQKNLGKNAQNPAMTRFPVCSSPQSFFFFFWFRAAVARSVGLRLLAVLTMTTHCFVFAVICIARRASFTTFAKTAPSSILLALLSGSRQKHSCTSRNSRVQRQRKERVCECE